MASNQISRRENTIDDKDKDSETTGKERETHEFESIADKVRDMEVSGYKERKPEDADKEAESIGPFFVGKFEATDEGDKEQQKNQGLGGTSEYAKEKAAQANDTLKEGAHATSQYALQKAAQAKNAAVSAGETTAYYVGEKAAAAKDVAVESGKGAAGYAEKVAVEAKDKAVVAGWAAAHYSVEKTVEGSKAAARGLQEAAGYAGEKAAVAGKKVVEVAAKPFQAAGAKGESAKEFTGRKKEEAERELEAKRSADSRQDTETESTKKQEEGSIKEEQQDLTRRAEMEGCLGIAGGGVMGAIGETIVEIAQTTKDLVIGSGDTGKEEHSYDQKQEPK